MYHAVAPLGHFMSNLKAEESQRWALCVQACVSLNPMSQSLLHQRCPGAQYLFFLFCFLSFLLLSHLTFIIFSFPFLISFPKRYPSLLPEPRLTHRTSPCTACMTFSWTIIIKKRVLEFRAPVVSMEGQLQTWISLQIKESLWGPNPVRHSLGSPYKGSTLNPLSLQLNEITPAMCDTLWF